MSLSSTPCAEAGSRDEAQRQQRRDEDSCQSAHARHHPNSQPDDLLQDALLLFGVLMPLNSALTLATSDESTVSVWSMSSAGSCPVILQRLRGRR